MPRRMFPEPLDPLLFLMVLQRFFSELVDHVIIVGSLNHSNTTGWQRHVLLAFC